jgi:hypothetical protein
MKTFKTYIIFSMVTLLIFNSEAKEISSNKPLRDTTKNRSELDNIDKDIKELQFKYELDKKTQEITLLKKDIALKNQDFFTVVTINLCIIIVSIIFCILWIVFMTRFYRLKKLYDMMKK